MNVVLRDDVPDVAARLQEATEANFGAAQQLYAAVRETLLAEAAKPEECEAQHRGVELVSYPAFKRGWGGGSPQNTCDLDL